MGYVVPEELIVESDGPVRIVTMNNPDALNAMVDPLHDAMCDIWHQLAVDDACLAVVLTGAGRAFCAGGNIPGFIRDYHDPEHRRYSTREARRLMDEMAGFHKPLVGAVNGAAVGLGCSIAVLCDIVIMNEDTFMADTHVNVGLVAGDGGAVAWPLFMSLLKAKEYVLTGDRIPARTCVELGLANRTAPADQVVAEATALAHRLAAQPSQAVQETKRALNLHLQAAIQLVAPFALSAEAESFATEDVKNFVERFQEK